MTQPARHLTELAALTSSILSGSAVHQVGAIWFRAGFEHRTEVLLVTTRGTKRWTIPKGWTVPGCKPHKAAAIEAWEEGGVKGKARKKAFGSYSYVKILSSGPVPAIVDVYVLETTKSLEEFPERQQRNVLWLPPLEASLLVTEPELKSLLVKFSKRAA